MFSIFSPRHPALFIPFLPFQVPPCPLPSLASVLIPATFFLPLGNALQISQGRRKKPSITYTRYPTLDKYQAFRTLPYLIFKTVLSGCVPIYYSQFERPYVRCLELRLHPVLASAPCGLPAVWPWGSHSTSLCLTRFIYSFFFFFPLGVVVSSKWKMIQVSTTDVLAMIRCFYRRGNREIDFSRHTAARRHLDSGLFCNNIP